LSSPPFSPVFRYLISSLSLCSIPVYTLHRSAARAFRTWRPSENYLVQFTGEQLSDSDLVRIWEAYDVNGDGRMDREELAFLMEDLCEVRGGIFHFRCVVTEARTLNREAVVP